MTGFFNCTTKWIVVLTDGYGGFCSALNESEGFYGLADALTDIWDKLDYLREDELLHEIDCGAVAFLRGRIENHYRLPGYPQTYSMDFAHACNKKNVRRIFSAWRTKAKKLGKDERTMLSSMLDDVQDLYLRKVLYFKQLFKDAAPQPSETASKYDWNRQIVREPFKPNKTPDYAAIYDELKNANAIDAYEATTNRTGMTFKQFVYYAQRAAFGDMFQWAKEHGMAMRLKAWILVLSQAFDREWRVKACEEMGIKFNYLSNNGSTKSKIKAKFAKN